MKLLRVVFLVLPLLALSAHASVLNSANAFGILGASTVTNTGPSVVGRRPGCLPRNGDHWISLQEVRNRNDASTTMPSRLKLRPMRWLATTISQAWPSRQTLTGQDLGGLTLESRGLLLRVVSPVDRSDSPWISKT